MGDASWLCSSPSQPPGNLEPGAGTGLPFSKQSKKKANLQADLKGNRCFDAFGVEAGRG